MDRAQALLVAGWLAEVTVVADEVAPLVDEVEQAEALARCRDEIGRAIERLSAGGVVTSAQAAEPVWLCAGVILGLDLEDMEMVAERVELLGDRIVRVLPEMRHALG